MVSVIIQALYFFLPVYFSNMAPVLFGKFNIFPQSIDGGGTIKGIALFGKNKTWGGLLYGVVLGTVIFYVQQILYVLPFFQSLSLFDYGAQPLLLGVLLAAGAIVGDLVKSFFKRRLGKKPGNPWVPWDQLDLVVGGFLFSAILYVPPLSVFIVIFLATPFLHYLTNVIGYFLGLKNVKW